MNDTPSLSASIAYSTDQTAACADAIRHLAQLLGKGAATSWLSGSLTAVGAMSAALPKSDQ